MSLQDDYQIAQRCLTTIPARESNQLFNEAKNAAADAHIEEMAKEFYGDVPKMGRQTALDIFFALALCLDNQ